MGTTHMHIERDAMRGRRIKEAAHTAGITLRDLAVHLGIARPTIYAYVAGTLRVPPARLQAIAKATGRPIEFFDQMGDKPGHWDGEMAVQHTDALMSGPDCAAACHFALATLEQVPTSDALARGRLLQRAGTARLYLGEYIEAIGHLDDASRAFGDAGLADRQGDCSQSLGYCYLNIGLIDRARAAFADALQKCDAVDRWRAQTALASADERVGDFDSAESRLAQAGATPGLPSIAKIYVGANLATLAANRGYWDLCVERSLPVLEGAVELGLRDQTIERMTQIGLARVQQGLLEEASLWLIRAADAAALVGDHARGVLVRLVTATLSSAVGDPDAARKDTVDALAEATRHQYRRSEAYAQVQLARLALMRDDPAGALDAAIQAQTFCETYRYFVHGFDAAVYRAHALVELGRAEEADLLLDGLERDARTAALGGPRAALLFARASAANALHRREVCDDAADRARILAEGCGARVLLESNATSRPSQRAYFLSGSALKTLTTPLDS